MASTIQVVHCVDTEGPLYESVEATFGRLKDIFDLDLPPSRELLERLQAGEVDLGGIESAVARVVHPHLLGYNDTWDKVDAMLERIMSPSFRSRVPDSFGDGWVYSWFCVDHVGYGENPRRRDIGYLNVFDHYRGILRDLEAGGDQLFWHFHPHNSRHEAHRCATHWWANSDSIFQILSRRVIDRGWFPAAHRPGFHAIRPDGHWFLEQYVPFDYSSQAMATTEEDTAAQFGLAGGRFGDWRRAPVSWTPYHPSADDYQVPGDSRRWIARCLNVGTRFRLITEDDVRQAFEEASQNKPVVLSVTNHDFRDMAPDVDEVRDLLVKVGRDYPDVRFRYTDAVTAMRDALALPQQPPCEFTISIEEGGESSHVLVIESPTPTFGPQPWFCFKTRSGGYHHDNLDIDVPFHRWQYVFDAETAHLDDLAAIGIAANNSYGSTTVAVVDARTRDVATHRWNEPAADSLEPADA